MSSTRSRETSPPPLLARIRPWAYLGTQDTALACLLLKIILPSRLTLLIILHGEGDLLHQRNFPAKMFVGSLWSPASVYLTAAVVVFITLANLYRNYRRCHQVKGPWLASVSSLWLFRSTFRSRIYLDCASLLNEYGRSDRHADQNS